MHGMNSCWGEGTVLARITLDERPSSLLAAPRRFAAHSRPAERSGFSVFDFPFFFSPALSQVLRPQPSRAQPLDCSRGLMIAGLDHVQSGNPCQRWQPCLRGEGRHLKIAEVWRGTHWWQHDLAGSVLVPSRLLPAQGCSMSPTFGNWPDPSTPSVPVFNTYLLLPKLCAKRRNCTHPLHISSIMPPLRRCRKPLLSCNGEPVPQGGAG
ncbi:hypothetical protein QBC34DRAFT_21181 [Podospora aff. communis PSN243]|uniref:Uncharacterized protein n=1 Tax=Podospora aff. communis PSN243 TaxID=3040156 RepID=A0AAV9GXI6_9PEZI|nr:hypothetical protein QBC34DRAFT_21181 [Podospora aff. communis PSN243]